METQAQHAIDLINRVYGPEETLNWDCDQLEEHLRGIKRSYWANTNATHQVIEFTDGSKVRASYAHGITLALYEPPAWPVIPASDKTYEPTGKFGFNIVPKQEGRRNFHFYCGRQINGDETIFNKAVIWHLFDEDCFSVLDEIFEDIKGVRISEDEWQAHHHKISFRKSGKTYEELEKIVTERLKASGAVETEFV